MYYQRMLTLLCITLTTVSCSYLSGDNKIITDRDSHYLTAKSVPPLKIPPGLSAVAIEPHYPVSENPSTETVRKPSLIPPELNK